MVSGLGLIDASSGDYNELIYLRARMYAPGKGRFLTKDTWEGETQLPLSLNRWNYVGGNPVNLADPSGHLPPIWCQMMPSKGTYELCVDQYYKIEPISYLELGAYVQGQTGCYKGPFQYRAPGYIEGFGLTITPSVVNWLFAFESVYDFASMEQGYFINNYVPGLGLSDSIWGITVAQYAGVVYGLKTKPSDITQDYPGPVFQYFSGISGDLGIGIGAGRTKFVSPLDHKIHGETWYVSASLSVDLLEGVDFGAGYISLAPVYRLPISYLNPADANQVNGTQLYIDIMLGRQSVWPGVSNPFNGGIPIDWAARSYGAYMAMNYAMAYEELHQ